MYKHLRILFYFLTVASHFLSASLTYESSTGNEERYLLDVMCVCEPTDNISCKLPSLNMASKSLIYGQKWEDPDPRQIKIATSNAFMRNIQCKTGDIYHVLYTSQRILSKKIRKPRKLQISMGVFGVHCEIHMKM